MDYMLLPLKRCFDFSGRSRRKEYWMFVLFLVIGQVVTSILDTVLGLGGTTTAVSDYGDGSASASFSSSGGMLTTIFVLAMLVPGIAVAIRRAHDQDKSGWFVLIPVYGLIMMFLDGTRGPNRFGPDPKSSNPAATFA